MKKLIVSALALASMIACSKNEVVEKQDFSTAITFEQVFVENATRAAVDPSTNNTTNPLTAFDVYGFMNQTDAVVFDGDDVKKNSDEKWVYTDIQYWMPGNVYYFGALAPMNSANWTLNTTDANTYGVGKIEFTNVNGTEDLLYAATTITAGATAEECAKMEPVKLTFNHLLSKVKFSFKNTFSTNKVTVDVTDIKMTVPAKGSIDLAVENWWDGDDWTHEENTTIDLELGNVTAMATTDSEAKEATYERLTIPTAAEHEYKVTFTITVYQSGVEAYQVTKEATIKNVALEMGKAYNFVANISQDNLGLKPIEFEVVEVKDWVTSQTPDDQVMEAELRAAMQLGGEVTLTKDFELTTPLIVPAGVSTVLNLNGHRIINTTESEEFGKGEGIIAYGKLTIKGDGTVEGSTMAVWARGENNAEVNIYDGNFYGCKEGFAKGGRSVIYASSGNTINIYGGTVEALAVDETSYANPTYAALNVADNNGYINVYGGTFVKQNPAVPGTEPKAWNQTHPNGFVAEGYYSNQNGDNYVVADALIINSAEELAAALTADAKTISVMLNSDIECPITSLGSQTPGSGEYKLGGESTENITINLNGKKLTITTTYWSGLGAKNADAIFTIKNGTMTSSQATGTWNSYDLTFANCKYVFEDVVFEKAIALANANKSTEIKNVTINETHDYYAMWISAKGQTVSIDGLTINSAGRGIKIDEQYVSTPAKVTLNVNNATFKTANKAAIMVKSAAGAEIKVTAINIANVAADQTNAVWVDTDAAAYADKVVVTGATCITEP